MANLKKNDYMNRENLKAAFDFFDIDHDGKISVLEFRRVFVGIKEEATISSAISQVDTDGDGQVILYYQCRSHIQNL